jgi:hypothetical protein
MFIFNYLLLVTILTGNLQETTSAYQQHLQFEPVAEGQVSAQQAALWQTPQLDDKAYRILRAASNKPAYLRFVEVDKTFIAAQQQRGWRAVELLSSDVELMAKKLIDSPFRIIGPPAWISANRNVKAMQIEAPGGEVLYLSQVIDKNKMMLTKVQAETLVDRPFIMVAGGIKHDEAMDFYQELGLKTLGPFPYRIDFLAQRLQLPLDTLFDLSLVQVTPELSLEIDKYPSAARDQLPNPVFSITLVAQQATDEKRKTPAMTIKEFPYDNRETIMLEGKLGERFEIIYDTPSSRSLD